MFGGYAYQRFVPKGLTGSDKGAAADAIRGGIIAADSKTKERVMVGYGLLINYRTGEFRKISK